MKKRSINKRRAGNVPVRGEGASLRFKKGGRVITCFLSACYTGYLPFMPGTFGSAFASVLVFLFPVFFRSLPAVIVLIVLLTAAAVAAFDLAGLRGTDPGWVVVDEVIGSFVAVAGHRLSLLTVIGGFILFRIFDILKPFPVKHAERLPGGYGVVADDIVAGIYASIFLFAGEYALG